MSNQEMMTRMAYRASSNPDYIAYLFELYSSAEKTEWSAIARQLGLDEIRLARVALSRRPRQETFDEDIERIAEYVEVDVTELLSILRHAEALEVFRANSNRTGKRWLMAARDKEDENESDI